MSFKILAINIFARFCRPPNIFYFSHKHFCEILSPSKFSENFETILVEHVSKRQVEHFTGRPLHPVNE